MPIPLWVPMAVGAAMGVAKNIAGKSAAKKRRKVEAAKSRWAPWTGGPGGQAVGDPSMFGNVLQGGAAGAMFGQGEMGSKLGIEQMGAQTAKQAMDSLPASVGFIEKAGPSMAGGGEIFPPGFGPGGAINKAAGATKSAWPSMSQRPPMMPQSIAGAPAPMNMRRPSIWDYTRGRGGSQGGY